MNVGLLRVVILDVVKGIVLACVSVLTGWTLAGREARPIASSQGVQPTYRRDIAPIFKAKCIGCHSPGGPGPFALNTFEMVTKRAPLIDKVALLHTMPPTDARSELGRVVLYERLTDNETSAIHAWIKAGLPEGEGPTPTTPAANSSWRLGKPDLVLKTAGPVILAAEGAKRTKEFQIPIPIGESKTLVAFDIRPASPRAVWQALVAVEKEGESNTFLPTGVRTERLIGPWGYGYPGWKLPPDVGLPLTPKSRLAVRMLFHPTGKQEDAGFEVALYFSKTPRPLVPSWITLGQKQFVIPGDFEYTTLSASQRLGASQRVISIVPEARSTAKQVNVKVSAGREVERSLLSVYEWHTRWPGAYNFIEPPLLPQDALLTAQIEYKNSNHDNPDLKLDEIKRLSKNPPIFSGTQERDELFWVHIQVAGAPGAK